MTMYLSNRDVHLTGYEPAEFIDVPAMADDATLSDPVPPRREGGRGILSDQTRLNITRRAQEYISNLVGQYDGDSWDVRAVILELQHRGAFSGHDGGS